MEAITEKQNWRVPWHGCSNHLHNPTHSSTICVKSLRPIVSRTRTVYSDKFFLVLLVLSCFRFSECTVPDSQVDFGEEAKEHIVCHLKQSRTYFLPRETRRYDFPKCPKEGVESPWTSVSKPIPDFEDPVTDLPRRDFMANKINWNDYFKQFGNNKNIKDDVNQVSSTNQVVDSGWKTLSNQTELVLSRKRRDGDDKIYDNALLSTVFPYGTNYPPFQTSPIDSVYDRLEGVLTTIPDDYSSEIDIEEEKTNCVLGGRYPPFDNDTKTLVLGVLMTQVGDKRERLGLKIPGALSYAVHTVNERQILPDGYKLQFEMNDTRGNVFLSTHYVVNFICRGDVVAFIGPEHTCEKEAIIATSMNMPMISYACTDPSVKSLPTFARTNPSEKPLIRVTIETMKHFNWNKFSIVYMDEFSTMADTLETMAATSNMTVNHKVMTTSTQQFRNVISETKNSTRIYVFLGHRLILSEMLHTMSISGLMKPRLKNNYMLIYVDKEEYKPNDWITYMNDKTTGSKNQNTTGRCPLREETLMTFSRSFMVIGNRAPTDTMGAMEDKVRKYNQESPFCFGQFPGYKYVRRRPIVFNKKHLPYLSLSYLYDAVVQYAEAVASRYRILNFNSTKKIDVPTVAKDGINIINQLKNKTYQSILGYSVTMDEFAQSEGNYSVYFFYRHPNCTDNKESPCSHCLLKISDFVVSQRVLTTEIYKNRWSDLWKEFTKWLGIYLLDTEQEEVLRITEKILENKLVTDIKIHLLDEPPCGYDGSLCRDNSLMPRKVAAYVMGALLILIVFWSTIQYRKWKYEQEIAGLQWRIDKKELCHINPGYGCGGSIASLHSVLSHDFHGQQLFFKSLADYRGIWVCLKTITMESRPHKKAEFSRPIMKEIRNLREMKQDNVCSLVGAYLDDNTVTLATEYCPRGSLEDILENEDIKLDQLFVSSLTEDLVRVRELEETRGIRFLHSNFGPHGNLKSSNCVVTGRWVLQVTDYGLHDLRKENIRGLVDSESLDMGTEEGARFLKSQLWRAPELLRQSPLVPGTKEGDIYAFGIIFHEIIGRQGPFSINNGDCPNYADIIRDVKSGSTLTGNKKRPSILELTDMPFGSNPVVIGVMESCWSEDPMKRPDFRNIKIQLKKMTEEKRKGNIMDHLLVLMQGYSKNLEELVSSRTMELREEKRKTEDLLHRMLPPSVASCLTRNRPVEPQNFDSVTIYFSDIVGFTALCAESTPFEVVTFLDDLYRMFDDIISGYDVYKVETIGDAYMVVSGLPNKNDCHAGNIASMALELVHQTKTNFVIRHKPEKTLKLRVGLHTGPVMAGVVGVSMPRYCLFGDTVNTAARMESNGLPLQIHISEQSRDALEKMGGYVIEERGLVEMKGKGEVFTYWLRSTTQSAIQRRVKAPPGSGMRSPLCLDGEVETRRHSPRLASELRRFSLGARSFRSSMASRSFDGSGENLMFRRGMREPSPLSKESPKLEHPDLQRRKLSAALRAASLECTLREGLLSPPRSPKRGASPDSNRTSHSLEQLRPSSIRLEVPRVASLGAGKLGVEVDGPYPQESEPSPLRVNFGKLDLANSQLIDHDDKNAISMSLLDENQPMLDEEKVMGDGTNRNAGPRRHSSIRSWFGGLLKPLQPTKVPMNGLHKENVV